MAGRRIAVSGGTTVQPVGVGESLAVDQWDTLTALLAAELSPAHAALFAEPMRSAARGEFAWYATEAGDVVRAADLPDAARAELLQQLDRMLAEIRALAKRILAKGDPSSRFTAALIDAATVLPEPLEPNLYAVDGRPLMVLWGHQRAGQGARRETLTGRTVMAEQPMAILPPPLAPMEASGSRLPFLAALAGSLLLLVAVLLFLWRDPYGLLRPIEIACAADTSQLAQFVAARREEERAGALRRELARLMADAGGRRAACAPLPAPPPASPRAAIDTDDVERARRAGGQGGALQIVLAWEGESDLDLHVFCSGGGHLYFNAGHACGGALDVDANRGGRPTMPQPVENARWETAPTGTYRIEVHNYRDSGGGEVPFRVTVLQSGQPPRTFIGSARASGARVVVAEIVVTP